MKTHQKCSGWRPHGGPLVAAVALFAMTLVACGDDGDGAAPATTTSSAVTTTAPTTTSTVATTTTSAGRSTSTSTTTAGGRAKITATVDGQPVALQTVCRGVDGAVVTIATTGRRIILVREQGLALRIGTEGGTFAETKDVRTTQTGAVPARGEDPRGRPAHTGDDADSGRGGPDILLGPSPTIAVVGAVSVDTIVSVDQLVRMPV